VAARENTTAAATRAGRVLGAAATAAAAAAATTDHPIKWTAPPLQNSPGAGVDATTTTATCSATIAAAAAAATAATTDTAARPIKWTAPPLQNSVLVRHSHILVHRLEMEPQGKNIPAENKAAIQIRQRCEMSFGSLWLGRCLIEATSKSVNQPTNHGQRTYRAEIASLRTCQQQSKEESDQCIFVHHYFVFASDFLSVWSRGIGFCLFELWFCELSSPTTPLGCRAL
jgi:hypothetical protein